MRTKNMFFKHDLLYWFLSPIDIIQVHAHFSNVVGSPFTQYHLYDTLFFGKYYQVAI